MSTSTTPVARSAVTDPDTGARRYGAFALVGVAIFAAIVIALHYLQPEYEPGSSFMSEYVLGDVGLLMNVAFLGLAGGIASAALGLKRSLAPGKRVTASVVVLLVAAVGILLSGLFNTDPVVGDSVETITVSGAIHDLSGFLAFITLIVSAFMLRGVFSRDAAWRPFAPTAAMFGVTMLVLLVVLVAAPMEAVGVAQRPFILAVLLWIGTIGCSMVGAGASRQVA